MSFFFLLQIVDVPSWVQTKENVTPSMEHVSVSLVSRGINVSSVQTDQKRFWTGVRIDLRNIRNHWLAEELLVILVRLVSIKIVFVTSIVRIPFITKIQFVAMMATPTEQSVSLGSTLAGFKKRLWWLNTNHVQVQNTSICG